MNHLTPLGRINHNDNGDKNSFNNSNKPNDLHVNSRQDQLSFNESQLSTVPTNAAIVIDNTGRSLEMGTGTPLPSSNLQSSTVPSSLPPIMVSEGDEGRFISQTTEIGTSATKRRKRVKPTKSCNFCRKRKLKCDHARPMCSSCKCRGLRECIYSDQPPEIPKHRKLNQCLRQPVVNQTTESQTLPTSSFENTRNPFRDHYYLESKPNGRYIVYGPTSMKTYVMRSNWGFLDKFQQLWSKVEVERDAWKRRHEKFGIREFDLLNSNIGGPRLDLDGIVSSLPSWDAILEHIREFMFPLNNSLYEMNTVVDKEKILRDFNSSFIREETTGKVYRLQLDGEDQNYYKIAVILMIITFVKFKNCIPDNIEAFFTFLTGLSGSKVHCIERVQFLLLRCFYVDMYLSEEDKTESTVLIDLTCSAAVSMGLHLNIRELYANKQDVVGSTAIIENLWSWILYFDTTLAVHNGRPLNISVETFNRVSFTEEDTTGTDELTVYETSFEPKTATGLSQDLGIPTDLRGLESRRYTTGPNEFGSRNESGTITASGRLDTGRRKSYAINYETDKSFFGKLRRLLFILRPMVSKFYEDYGVPDVIQFAMKLIRFMEDEFLSVNYFTDPTLIGRVPVGDIRLVVTIFSTATSFFVLSFTKLNLRKVYVKNICMHLQFLLFTMFKNYTRYCYEIDKRRFPETLDPESCEFPPYLNSAIPLFRDEIQKALTMSFSFIYLKATLFERGIFLLSDMVDVEWDISTLRTPMEKDLTLIAGARIIVRTFDDWLGVGSTNEDDIRFRSVLKRFYPFLSIIALEDAYRTVIEQAIEYRKRTEKMWIELHLRLKDSGNKSKVQVCYASVPEVGDDGPTGSNNGQLATPQQDDLQRPEQGQQQQQQQLQDELSGVMEYSQHHFKQLLFDSPIMPQSTEPAPSDIPRMQSPFSATGSDAASVESPQRLAQELADEFWSNYNAGWEELIQQRDIFSVFHDAP